eukprot:3516845-Lingulodinium_polyedra.AAC.1
MKRSEAVFAERFEWFAAQRVLVRYANAQFNEDAEERASASEDWVRLSIALRRVYPPGTRITMAILRQWNTK